MIITYKSNYAVRSDSYDETNQTSRNIVSIFV